MRVYHLITELEPAGAERVLYQLVRGLDQERFESRVGALVAGGSVGAWLRAAGVGVYEGKFARRGWRRPLSLVPGFLGVLSDLRRFRPHLIHAHLWHASMVARLAAPLVGSPPVLSHVHIVERRPFPWRDRLDRLTRGLIVGEICVSQAVAADRRNRVGLAEDRLHVVPNGVDLERALRREPQTKLSGPTRLQPRRPSVLAIGRLDRQKGFDVLLAAVARVIEHVPDLEVVIVGEGPERERLEQAIADLELGGTVRLAGFREDIGRFLAGADLFAMPSRWEGFGITAVEALAAGVPVVASRVDSLPEIVEHGATGLLVPPNDPGALAGALVELLRDDSRRARLGALGPRSAERFTAERMVTAISDLYDTCSPTMAE